MTNTRGISSALPDGRRNPEYTRRDNLIRKQAKHDWYLANSQRLRPIRHEYYISHIERLKEAQRKWNASHAHERLKYAYNWRQSHPEEWKAINRRWGSIQAARRKRDYPTTTIVGTPFPNSNLHHVTPDFAVYIPAQLNRSIPHSLHTGKNMDEINTLVWLWFESQDASTSS